MELDECTTNTAELYLEDKIFSDIDENYSSIITHASRRKSSRKSLLSSIPVSPLVNSEKNLSPVVNRNRMSFIHKRNSIDVSKTNFELTNPTFISKVFTQCCNKVEADMNLNNVPAIQVNSELKFKNICDNVNPTADNINEKNIVNKSFPQIKYDEFCPDKLVESYQKECIQWDKLVEKYKADLLKKDFTFPDRNWIENNYDLSKYAEFIWGSNKREKGYSGKYNSFEELIQSISNSSATILYELERLSFMYDKQSLFISALRHKLRAKQLIMERSNFSTKSVHDILSDLVFFDKDEEDK